MNALDFSFSPALTRALGWTLLHSLWQGALVAAILFGALLLLRHRTAALRYRAAAAALAAVVLLTLGTFGRYYVAGQAVGADEVAPVAGAASGANEAQNGRARGLGAAANAAPVLAGAPAAPPVTSAAASATAASAAETGGLASGAATAGGVMALTTPTTHARPVAAWLNAALPALDRHLPLLVLAWGIGLLLMGLRLLGGLLLVQRLRRYRVQPLPEIWQARLAALAGRAGLRRSVQLLESALVTGPVVLGHLRPVVLLPLGAVAGLPPGYLEAILAHEVAHVLRRDYLLNLLLTVAETVFFYHPAVWFVGGCLRTERENCCDDLATELVGGDALRLARALTALAEWTQAQAAPVPARPAPQLALAALGGRGSLLGRVRRLVVQHRPAPTRTEGTLALLLLLGSLGLLGAGATVAGPLAGQAARGWRSFAKTVRVTTKTIATSLTDTTRRTGAGPNFNPATTSEAASEAAAAEVGQRAGTNAGQRVGANAGLNAGTDAAPRTGTNAARSSATNRPAGLEADTSRRTAQNRRDEREAPATVVITKDKKGRVKELVVNGKRIEAATDRKARPGPATGPDQVLVVPLPPAPPRPPVPDFGENSAPPSEREIERLSRRIERSAGRVVTVDEGRRDEDVVRIDLDKGALRNLVGDALALSAASVNLGLAEASRGLREAQREVDQSLRGDGRRRVRVLPNGRNHDRQATATEAARRDLRRQLQNPKLNAETRRSIEEAARDLDEAERDLAADQRAAEADARQADADSRQAEEDTRQADADTRQADADSRQAEADTRQAEADSRAANPGAAERRRELQNEIRRAEAELRRLKREAGETAPPVPPRALRYNYAPPVPRNGYAPRAPRGGYAPSQALPAPPAPPSTTKLRDTLRRDGLIGPKTTDFTFDLNDDGMRVNGQPQPAATAEKYRRLLTPADSKGHRGTFKMRVTESKNSTTTVR